MRKKTRKTKPFFSLDEHDITILQNHQYFLKYQILLFIYYYSCYYFFVTISYHCILLLLGYYFHITTLCILLQPVLLLFLGFSKIKIVTPFQFSFKKLLRTVLIFCSRSGQFLVRTSWSVLNLLGFLSMAMTRPWPSRQIRAAA